MTWLSNLLLILAGVFGGGLVMGIVGLPLAYRYGREATAREAENAADALERVKALRDDTAELPKQYGTLHEHRRRLPLRFGEVTDTAVLDAVEEDPHGAEPAFGQVRVGVTGRALPANVWGNAAPTQEEEAPSYAGGPAGSWPLVWWVVWLALLPVHYLVGWRHFWDTTPGQAVDRAAVWLGRYEPRWWTDRDHPPHSILAQAPEQLTVEEILARLAAAGEGVELAGHSAPVRELVGVAG